jgi:hypothetical protein
MKDRKFEYLLNVEESLDLMLADKRLKRYLRYFNGNELLIERDKDNPNKLVVIMDVTTKVYQNGHTEIESF